MLSPLTEYSVFCRFSLIVNATHMMSTAWPDQYTVGLHLHNTAMLTIDCKLVDAITRKNYLKKHQSWYDLLGTSMPWLSLSRNCFGLILAFFCCSKYNLLLLAYFCLHCTSGRRAKCSSLALPKSLQLSLTVMNMSLSASYAEWFRSVVPSLFCLMYPLSCFAMPVPPHSRVLIILPNLFDLSHIYLLGTQLVINWKSFEWLLYFQRHFADVQINPYKIYVSLNCLGLASVLLLSPGKKIKEEAVATATVAI